MTSRTLIRATCVALFVLFCTSCGSDSEEPTELEPIEELEYGVSCDPNTDVCASGLECRLHPGGSRIGEGFRTCSEDCDPSNGAWAECGARPCEVEFEENIAGSVDGVGGGTCSNPSDGLAEGEECSRPAECGEGLICTLYAAEGTPLILRDGSQPFETCRRWCRPSTGEGGCTDDEVCVDISISRFDLDDYDLGICALPLELGEECADTSLPCRGGHCLVSDTDSECRVECDNLEQNCPDGEVCRRVPMTNEDYVCQPE